MTTTQKIQTIFQTRFPIIQAPMAGAQDSEMAIAVIRAGGLGSLPCAMLSSDQIRAEVKKIRNAGDGPFNLNFFCHTPAPWSDEKQNRWKSALRPYYLELGLDPEQELPKASRNPFDENACRLIEELKPPVVSFHFGLPNAGFVQRIKEVGSKILSSATTVEEAIYLERNGCEAIIAQGSEAGGHRAIFLNEDLSSQVPMLALVSQILSEVSVPVIASGGIADAHAAKEAFDLGAAAIQVGTAYLFTPEAKISDVYRAALRETGTQSTAITNLFSGRPARGIVNRILRELGPISSLVPDFPYASSALQPLKQRAEKDGRADFTNLWAGESFARGRETDSETLTRSFFK